MAKIPPRYTRRNQFAAAFRDFKSGIEEPLLGAELPLLEKEIQSFEDDAEAELPHLEKLLVEPFHTAIEQKNLKLLEKLLGAVRSRQLTDDIEFDHLAWLAANAAWCEGYKLLAPRGKDAEGKISGLDLIQVWKVKDPDAYDASTADFSEDVRRFREWAEDNDVSEERIKRFLAKI